MRPSRRIFMQTALACVAVPVMPKIVVSEMHFHSVGIGGDIAEMFDMPSEEYGDMAWEIVPAYNADQAVQQIRSKVRDLVSRSSYDWPAESEWKIKSYYDVAESEVIESAKDWDVGFDDAAGRLMGWRVESDEHCECCDRYSMDQRVPTCSECYRCKPCLDAGEPYYCWKDNVEKHGPCPHCHWV